MCYIPTRAVHREPVYRRTGIPPYRYLLHTVRTGTFEVCSYGSPYGMMPLMFPLQKSTFWIRNIGKLANSVRFKSPQPHDEPACVPYLFLTYTMLHTYLPVHLAIDFSLKYPTGDNPATYIYIRPPRFHRFLFKVPYRQ
jgi:hypothetical protein